MLKIVVYGSLRAGMGNYGLLSRGNAQLLSTEIVSLPFEMIDMGGFPGLIHAEKVNQMVAEVYGVDEKTYRSVERLEGYPSFYDKHTVETTQGSAEVYVLNQGGSRSGWGYEQSQRVRMFDNAYDWVKHYTKKHESETAD
jgi:gamma-glutamylcyclotransferase (GGCT)/AIG2-like uncharacterized protein YtfP